MAFENICSPALIYIFFSLTQIVIDTSNGLYNTAFLKLWVAILFATLLNYLCDKGLGIISWFIVFIPFILMTLIISILLLVFGLDPSSGKQIINFDKKPAQPRPKDYRVDAARMSGNFYDNYNDANVNTMVNATSQATTSSTSQASTSQATTSSTSQATKPSTSQASKPSTSQATTSSTTSSPTPKPSAPQKPSKQKNTISNMLKEADNELNNLL